MHRECAFRLRQSAICPHRRRPLAGLHANFDAARGSFDRPWFQPFSATYCDIAARRISVSSSRRFAATPPKANVTAASDCAMAIAPVRLGKNPGEDADSNSSRCAAPSAIGAVMVSAIAIKVAPDLYADRHDSTLAVE